MTPLTIVCLSALPVVSLAVVLSLLVSGVSWIPRVPGVWAGPGPAREEESPQQQRAEQQRPDEEVGGVQRHVVSAARGEDGPLLSLLRLSVQINTRPTGGNHWVRGSEMAPSGGQMSQSMNYTLQPLCDHCKYMSQIQLFHGVYEVFQNKLAQAWFANKKVGISGSFLWQKWQKLWQLRHGWRTLWQHGQFLWNNVVFSSSSVTLSIFPNNHSVTLRLAPLCALHWAMHATETGANALFWARNTFLRAQRSLNARCEGYHYIYYMTPGYERQVSPV